MDIIQLVVQFGAVGIALYLVYCQTKERKEYLKIIGNHIDHNTKALTKLIGFIEKDVEVTKDLAEVVRKVNGKDDN